MAPKTYFIAVLLFGCFVAKACSQRNFSKMPAIVFVGSTPYDPTIKTPLQIPANTACDFIRWELTFQGDQEDSAFLLNVAYGASQPNTLGFKGCGEISLLVGDENVLFFLNQEYELYVGNSDFSYTLNKKQ